MKVSQTIADAQQMIVKTARDMLNGEISFIEGSRQLLHLQAAAEIQEPERDFDPFLAIQSESASLPFGEVRQYWNPRALINLQPEIERAESWANAFGSP